MKLEINEGDVSLLSPEETADQLVNPTLEKGEYIGDVRVEFDELYVDIHAREPMDKRIDGTLVRTEVFTLCDILQIFEAANYYCWARDEDGNTVLACFGC